MDSALGELDDPGPNANESTVTAETILAFLHAPSVAARPCDSEVLGPVIARYREIADSPVRLPIAPSHPMILDRFVWPLRHAIGSYMVGNYLSTISLCGAVAEWLAILLFEMAHVTTNGQEMTIEGQKNIFSREFERLGQERRIGVLVGYGIIGEDLKSDFLLIKDTRNNYLHFLSRQQEAIAIDAVKVYHATVKLVATSFVRGFPNGTIELQPQFSRWLEEHGAFQTVEP
jgi:hypothetical protein